MIHLYNSYGRCLRLDVLDDIIDNDTVTKKFRSIYFVFLIKLDTREFESWIRHCL